MARRLGTSITELVVHDLPLSVFMQSGSMTVTPAIDPRCWSSTRHQRKRTSEIVPLGKAKSEPDIGSAHSPIHCISKLKRFGTYSSAETVGYGTVQQTSHSSASVDQASSSTSPSVGPGTSKLDNG
ncbi:hypothetical protein AVEN_68744-1 [Araneus ventricosus]|uniref:Uncharacterized protein n=1 Tax=Araneus ventricosus TaxID=182803 RepID=A0A4Y2C4Q5_ARAVE|nr:hypothetical protein AVEN_68744-1 [Araneus ventricosus]